MRIAIIEDEKKARELLMDHVRRFGADTGMEIHAAGFRSGVEFVTSYRPVWDLILMDIEMPLQDGMSAARQIREIDEDVLLMFVTRFSKYAAEGYEVEAVDYLLKPVSYDFIAVKMNRILHLLRTRSHRSVIVRSQNSTHRIFLRALYYVEVFNHTLEYHTVYGNYTSTGRKSIRSLEKELQDGGFALTSQSHLVNLHYVESVESDGIILSDGVKLPLSRSKRKEFMQQLLQYWAG